MDRRRLMRTLYEVVQYGIRTTIFVFNLTTARRNHYRNFHWTIQFIAMPTKWISSQHDSCILILTIEANILYEHAIDWSIGQSVGRSIAQFSGILWLWNVPSNTNLVTVEWLNRWMPYIFRLHNWETKNTEINKKFMTKVPSTDWMHDYHQIRLLSVSFKTENFENS